MKSIFNPVVGVTLAALLTTGIAQAHPRIVGSNPVPNSIVTKPTQLTISFSERLLGPLTGATLTTVRAGHAVKSPTVVALDASNKMLIVKPKQPLLQGRYQLNWHAVSVDTHRVSGVLAFRVS